MYPKMALFFPQIPSLPHSPLAHSTLKKFQTAAGVHPRVPIKKLFLVHLPGQPAPVSASIPISCTYAFPPLGTSFENETRGHIFFIDRTMWRFLSIFFRLPLFGKLHLLFNQGSNAPLLLSLKLLFGLGSRVASPKPRLTPKEIRLLGGSHILKTRYDGITMLRQIPLFQKADDPTKSIYRMCEFLCADESNQLMLEMQYFWKNAQWALEGVPNPGDPNAERLAIFASVVESLVSAFNWRYSLGLRRGKLSIAKEDEEETEIEEKRGHDIEVTYPKEVCPPWTEMVLPLAYTLRLYEHDPYSSLAPKKMTPFSKRNIEAHAGNLFSI